ncbi:DMT family transporter [Jiella sonneratiae]|uniref:DMT family transporter n=1 Tax=Jiella sonneratiae TaxID=2816856 RepID=A0ABS3J2J1_9HYPH|nr:DMT family transporter [Jiella sonneratiae]MBO0903203.1 DMT family transporter [Jiella sonneratiae]
MGGRDWALLIALSLLWGGSFFFVEIAVKDLPVLTIVALRVSLAALVLLAVLRLLGIAFPMRPGVLLAFLGMGVLNNAVPFLLFVWSQTQIASGLAAILNATTPLFGVVVAGLLTKDEPFTRHRAAGVVLGFCGVVVLIGPAAALRPGSATLAELACLGAALSYAFAGVFGRRFRRMGISPLATATGQVSASSLILLPAALVADRPWTLPMPAGTTAAAILGIAVLSTALAYILYFRLLASAGATNLLLVTFLIPVSAILLGVLFLGEVLLPQHVAGMALIGLGLAAIDGRALRRIAGFGDRSRRGAGREEAERP